MGQARSLSDYDFRKLPRRGDRFIVEGRWAVDALLASEFFVHSVLIVEGQQEDLHELAAGRTVVLTCSKAEVQELAGFDFHRGVLASAARPAPRPVSGSIIQGGVVACPEIADESNLGAIVRNAAAFGAAAVVVEANRGADVFSRKAIRSSAGTVLRIPVFESPDLRADLLSLRRDGFTIIGTSRESDAVPLRRLETVENYVCLFGSEGMGLSPDWLDLCDVCVTIPMASGVDSLNVACSSAIILHELNHPCTESGPPSSLKNPEA